MSIRKVTIDGQECYKVSYSPEIFSLIQSRITNTVEKLETTKAHHSSKQEKILLQYITDAENQIDQLLSYGYCYLPSYPRFLQEVDMSKTSMQSKAALHNRRAPGKGQLTEDLLMWSIYFFESRCMYCGEHYAAIDHIKPISHGGTNTVNNVGPACQSCNQNKADQPVDQWYPKQDFYTEERYEKIKFHLEEGQNLYDLYK